MEDILSMPKRFINNIQKGVGLFKRNLTRASKKTQFITLLG